MTLSRIKTSVLAIACAAAVSAHADDPRDRDEDISAATVTVDVEQSNGIWRYEYSVVSPASNKGTVQFLEIDLECAQPVTEWETFDPSLHVPASFDDYSDHSATTPAAVHAAYGQAYDFALTVTNEAMFALQIKPGASVTGLVLVSPYGPKQRRFALRPDFMVSEQWDYPADAEFQPDIPGVEDFTIDGLILAPACPGEPTEDP